MYYFYTFICTLNKGIFFLFGPKYLQTPILFVHKIYKYRILNTIRSQKFTNTKYRIVFVTSKSTNTEYRIVLFGPNYSLIPNKHYSVQLWYAWIRQRIFDVSNGAYSSLFPPFPFISPIFSTFLLKRPKPDKKIS